MSETDFEETRDMWNRVAEDWRIQVGDQGDSNRLLNSDPVLWAFVGDVRGRRVLDAGCGTGYLSQQLRDRGADVTGVDFSERMVAVARTNYSMIDFRVDSCSDLLSIADEQFELLISNYVLMDTPDLEKTTRSFHRVLKPEGIAVVIFSHPCFPQGAATIADDSRITYEWAFSYFERRKCIDPPWGHFSSDFIWFHRPLSDYWKAFVAAGFDVIDFEEPRITRERYQLARTEKVLRNSRTRPYSVAFKLRKGRAAGAP